MTYARLAPRSGLAAKKMIDVGAGVVDFDYRGEVGVVLFNYGEEDFTVVAGDRVAQLVLEEISMADSVKVESLSSTERGSGGFGSTGVTTSAEVSAGQPAAADAGVSICKRPRVSTEALEVKLLSESASMPVRGSSAAAGFDLAASEHAVVKAGNKAIVKTGMSVAIPEGTYARIAPRSG